MFSLTFLLAAILPIFIQEPFIIIPILLMVHFFRSYIFLTRINYEEVEIEYCGYLA